MVFIKAFKDRLAFYGSNLYTAEMRLGLPIIVIAFSLVGCGGSGGNGAVPELPTPE